MEECTISIVGKLSTLKLSVLNLIYKFNMITNKTSADFFKVKNDSQFQNVYENAMF